VIKKEERLALMVSVLQAICACNAFHRLRKLLFFYAPIRPPCCMLQHRHRRYRASLALSHHAAAQQAVLRFWKLLAHKEKGLAHVLHVKSLLDWRNALSKSECKASTNVTHRASPSGQVAR
jgi:hypothetical protein